MALDSYSSANRVIDSGLVVLKDWTFVFGSWTGTSVVASAASVTYSKMYLYRRRARAAYRYVGMTRAAAETCAAAMKEKYATNSSTRLRYAQIWNATAGSMGDWTSYRTDGVACARVSISKDSANLYSVIVEVDEEDLVYSKSESPQSWATEDARDYDGLKPDA